MNWKKSMCVAEGSTNAADAVRAICVPQALVSMHSVSGITVTHD